MMNDYEKERWLTTRGGRTTADLRKDSNGEYVLMFVPGDDREFPSHKVYLPLYFPEDLKIKAIK